jgi:hypothetical protein
MSERGVFAIDRSAWEHDFLADDQPFSRREAWFWLVSEAAWKPHRRRIAGKVIELDRGQYVGSLRFIASKWHWSEPRVRRFLSGLISEGMVDAKADAGVTVITICNYDKYQRVSLPTDAKPESDDDAEATQERRKVEDKENKEITPTSLRSVGERAKRGTRLPDAWEPTPPDHATSLMLVGAERLRVELEKFRDYWAAQPGQRGVKLDWNATFRNWIRNVRPINGNRNSNPRATGHDAILAAATRAARKIAGDDGLAGATAEAEFPFGAGTDRDRSAMDRRSHEGAESANHRREPSAGGLLEGEIIPPDKAAAGFSDGWGRH